MPSACPRKTLTLLYCIVYKPTFCSEERPYLLFPKLFAIQLSLKKQSRTKEGVPLKVQEIYGNLSTNNGVVHITYFLPNIHFLSLSDRKLNKCQAAVYLVKDYVIAGVLDAFL